MRAYLLAAAITGLLGGCAGYAIDYTKPKTSIVAPELSRYGMDAGQSQCVGDRLATNLSVWQLRQLQIRANTLQRGFADPPRLTPPDLIWVAKHVDDPQVAAELGRAAEACGLRTEMAAASAPPPAAAPPIAEADTVAAPNPATPPAAPPASWINLGAAPSGQTIAVDAASLAEEGSYRKGWFRLGNSGETTRSSTSYLLRVDCSARTINSMAIRKHAASGAVTESRDFGPGGEGAAPVEAGTVMEIAYLALCT